jgi:hypothetical protein
MVRTPKYKGRDRLRLDGRMSLENPKVNMVNFIYGCHMKIEKLIW